MQIKQNLRNYLLLLLTLFLILQIIPGNSYNTECIDSHAQNSTSLFSDYTVNAEIAFLIPDGRKTTFRSISAKVYNCLIEHVYVIDTSENEITYHNTLADNRKEIEKNIPSYFHGSKYKESNLII